MTLQILQIALPTQEKLVGMLPLMRSAKLELRRMQEGLQRGRELIMGASGKAGREDTGAGLETCRQELNEDGRKLKT